MSEVETRYSHGGDEWILVELSEAMDIRINLRAQAICRRLHAESIPGIVDICCANASYLVRLDPDELDPRVAIPMLKELEADVGDAAGFRLETRVVEVPLLWQDEWTHEVLMKFRDHHQTPDKTDIEFAAEINGFESTEAFRDAVFATPLMGTMTGFVPGATWWYPLASTENLIQVPKYVRPRTDTPERAFGWGGAFAAIYATRGAGGYQLFGIVPTPQVDPARRLPDFRDQDWFFTVGDISVLAPVDRSEFDAIRAQVEAGRFKYRREPFEFVPESFIEDPEGTHAAIRRALYGP